MPAPVHAHHARPGRGIALLLGLVGLYGVIAYSASQRRREIGIRIALGAQRSTITGMFVRQGLILALTGIGCGVVLAFAATRLLSSLLFHVSPMDPITYVAACLALSAAAALASYIPSRRPLPSIQWRPFAQSKDALRAANPTRVIPSERSESQDWHSDQSHEATRASTK